MGSPSSLKTEAHVRQPPILQLCSRNTPLGRRPRVGHVFSLRFPGSRNMLWARKGPGPWRAGRSAGLPNTGQILPGFCPNQSRFGQNAGENWLEIARRSHLGRHTSAGPHPRGLAGHCEYPHPIHAKRNYRRRTAMRPMPADPRPVGVSFLVLYHGPRPITKTGLQRSFASTAFCFRGTVSRGLHIGNPEYRRHDFPTTQAPKAPPCLSDNPQSELNLCAQNEVIPILGRPIFPKDGGERPAATHPEVCSRNAPLHRRPRLGRVFSVRFACGRNMPWARKGPGPWRAGRSAGLPNAGNSLRAFCPNQSRFGQNARENWPENAQRSHLGGRTSAGEPPHSLATHCECPAPYSPKRHSVRRTAARPTPADPRPVGVPSVALYHGAGPITKPGLECSLASPAFCFRSPVPSGSIS